MRTAWQAGRLRGHPVRTAGFTLIEVMFAVVIMAASGAAMFGLLRAIIRMNGFAAEVNNSIALSSDKIENLLQSGYGALAGGSDVVGGFQRTWTVDSGPVAQTKVIAVRVSWTGSDHRDHARESLRLVSR